MCERFRPPRQHGYGGGTTSAIGLDVTLILENRAQSAMRRLLMVEPDPGSLLPDEALLALGQLVGFDDA